jgi:hypothetical protein
MHCSVYLPLLFSAAFGLVAPHGARRLPPVVATWLLSVGGLFSAVASALSLALVGFTLAGQSPLLAGRGHWSQQTLRRADPVWWPIAAAALAALLVLMVRFGIAAVRRLSALVAAYRLAAALPASSGELVVIPQRDRQAYAVPGRPGRIVVTTGMLSSMSAAERRALLAHERSHLIHHHHLHHAVAHLAAATNPLLRRIPVAVTLAAERWADEDAAMISNRATVATALTHAAVGGRAVRTPSAVLAAATSDIAARVGALQLPPPKLTLWRITLLVGLLAATALALGEAAHDTERLFELAQYVYRVRHG